MSNIEKIKAEIERIDRECQGKQYYIPARQKLDELRTFIDSLEKDEAPKRRLRDVPSWIAEIKAERGHEDEILQKRLEELRRIRAEKNRLNEAAFTYENELWESGYKNCGYSPQEVNDAFKAGAKWMTGQFQKIDGDLVDWYSTSDGKDYCCGVKTIEPHEVPEGFYIRKKKEKEDDRRNT